MKTPNTLNYTGQIQIADKLGQMYAENGGAWPDAVTAITNGNGELLNIDFKMCIRDRRRPSFFWDVRNSRMVEQAAAASSRLVLPCPLSCLLYTSRCV